MKSRGFGAYLKALREEKGIPQRIVAHAIDLDTSTLSKMELGERQITIAMIKPWAETLDFDFKKLQIRYISEKIMDDFNQQPFLKEALELVIEKILLINNRMNIAQIEINLQKLIATINKETFIFQLLLAYGLPKAFITPFIR